MFVLVYPNENYAGGSTDDETDDSTLTLMTADANTVNSGATIATAINVVMGYKGTTVPSEETMVTSIIKQLNTQYGVTNAENISTKDGTTIFEVVMKSGSSVFYTYTHQNSGVKYHLANDVGGDNNGYYESGFANTSTGWVQHYDYLPVNNTNLDNTSGAATTLKALTTFDSTNDYKIEAISILNGTKTASAGTDFYMSHTVQQAITMGYTSYDEDDLGTMVGVSLANNKDSETGFYYVTKATFLAMPMSAFIQADFAGVAANCAAVILNPEYATIYTGGLGGYYTDAATNLALSNASSGISSENVLTGTSTYLSYGRTYTDGKLDFTLTLDKLLTHEDEETSYIIINGITETDITKVLNSSADVTDKVDITTVGSSVKISTTDTADFDGIEFTVATGGSVSFEVAQADAIATVMIGGIAYPVNMNEDGTTYEDVLDYIAVEEDLAKFVADNNYISLDAGKTWSQYNTVKGENVPAGSVLMVGHPMSTLDDTGIAWVAEEVAKSSNLTDGDVSLKVTTSSGKLLSAIDDTGQTWDGSYVLPYGDDLIFTFTFGSGTVLNNNSSLKLKAAGSWYNNDAILDISSTGFTNANDGFKIEKGDLEVSLNNKYSDLDSKLEGDLIIKIAYEDLGVKTGGIIDFADAPLDVDPV